MTHITSYSPTKRYLSSKNDGALGKTYVITTKEALRLFGEKAARILSTIDYFLKKKDFGMYANGKKWIFSTFEYLSEKLSISLRHTKRLVASLHKQGVLMIQKLSDYKSNRTNYYTIDYDYLKTLMGEEPSQPSPSAADDLEEKMAPWPCHNDTMSSTEYTHKTYKSEKDECEEKDVSSTITSSNNPPTPCAKALPKTLARDMLALWNETCSKAKTTLSKDVARFLVAAYIKKFSHKPNLEGWKDYCQNILSNASKMGESFPLTLSWALKFSTIDRFLSKERGETSFPKKPEEKPQELHTLETLDEDPRCIALRQTLIKRYGVGLYISWIQPISLYRVGDKIHFKAKSPFHKETILQKFKEFME